MTDKIQIEDLINGNLRDMEFTAQFGVYRQAVKGLAEQNEELKKLAETHLAETINMQRELDLLKEELAICIQENEEGREINAELKAENDELKKYKMSKQSSYEKMQQQRNETELKNRKLKQALTEIKEISKKQIEWNIANLNSAGRSQTLAKRILQKISEVEDE